VLRDPPRGLRIGPLDVVLEIIPTDAVQAPTAHLDVSHVAAAETVVWELVSALATGEIETSEVAPTMEQVNNLGGRPSCCLVKNLAVAMGQSVEQTWTGYADHTKFLDIVADVEGLGDEG
jgi:hypothetical protein